MHGAARTSSSPRLTCASDFLQGCRATAYLGFQFNQGVWPRLRMCLQFSKWLVSDSHCSSPRTTAELTQMSRDSRGRTHETSTPEAWGNSSQSWLQSRSLANHNLTLADAFLPQERSVPLVTRLVSCVWLPFSFMRARSPNTKALLLRGLLFREKLSAQIPQQHYAASCSLHSVP